jgi:hypothetical protein
VHEVFTGTHPHLRRHFQIKVGKAIGGYQATVRDAACEAWILGAEHRATYGGMDAVCAHKSADRDPPAVLKFGFDAVAVIYQSGEAVPDMQALSGKGARHCVQEVAAMHLIVWKTEFGLHGVGERSAK